MSIECLTFYLPPLSGKQFGPYILRRESGVESVEIAHHIQELISCPPQRLGNTAWWVEPPKIPYDDFVLVLVQDRRSLFNNVDTFRESAVYVVQIPSAAGEETAMMTLEKIKRYVSEVYGSNAIEEESLQALSEPAKGGTEGKSGGKLVWHYE